MVRKCRGVAEIAVMEVDLRTTRPPPDNKRKITAGIDFEISTTTTSFLKLRSRRRRVLFPENSVPSPPAEITSISPTSDDDTSAFCCSSNACNEIVEESKFVDLEDENDEHGVAFKSSRERETTPSSEFQSPQSGDMESPARKSEATSSNRSSSSVKMPAESELEEFFIAAEKNIQKRFAEKYNYDIVEDVPLEGRYEWVRVKP
ncbi:cyclin-dependent kinase inhibitor 1-like isoform X2 [Benincasa hispida]|uniref:cyclin-dependent kinase inhibitor 1-like isoform X2 n=1 Tax=Benincasa hispida TaxID=102211 RepID=UPI0018FF81D7|nr:cyclin-dependent kinase inhibitor 1-like isoform X2 [Benincasa hispida]